MGAIKCLSCVFENLLLVLSIHVPVFVDCVPVMKTGFDLVDPLLYASQITADLSGTVVCLIQF